MYELKVEGMSCGHCVSAVTKSVLEIDSGAKVAVDLDQQKVSVVSSAPLEEIKTAVIEAGYPVLGSSES